MQLNNSKTNLSPLITVVIPTYNRMPFIIEAINSVITQTYTNWELFIIDDGSVDRTAETIKALTDPRIHLITQTHKGNISWLRNTGAEKGSGEWIAFLDSDDIWMPQKLQIQYNTLIKTGKRWCYGRFELMNEAEQTIPNRSGKYIPVSGWITKQLLTCEASINIGSLIVERKLFLESGGFNIEPALICREDYDLVLHLSLLAETVAVDDLLVRIREHKDRTTNMLEDAHERTAFVYEYFLNAVTDNKLKKIALKRSGYHIAEASINNLREGEYLQQATTFSISYETWNV
jgi:glycosyltransferase involved in cell wall biosynthesis